MFDSYNFLAFLSDCQNSYSILNLRGNHKKCSRNVLTCIFGVLLVKLKSRFLSLIASSMEKNQIEKEELDYRQVNIEKNVYDALEKRIKKISQDSELDKPFTVDEIVNSLIKSALIEDTSMV
jgi:hypothetical protein